MKYEVMFHFSSGVDHVLEVKRLDLPPRSTPDEVYRWMLISDRDVYPLTFEGMTILPQKRYFSEGMIEFDLVNCIGKIHGKDIDMNRVDDVSDGLRRIIEGALK